MKVRIFIAVAMLLFEVTLFAQTKNKAITNPGVNDFSGTLSFLSSDWMEGRETGTRGGYMAADYIASMMQLFQLEPVTRHTKLITDRNIQPGYFQDFEVLRYKVEKANLQIVKLTETNHSAFQLSQGVDFEVKSGPNGVEAEAPLIFAGYGISAADKGYDDFNGLNVKGKIEVVLAGLPGQSDTTSIAWKKLSRLLPDDAGSIENKLQTAIQHQATALIVISPDGSLEPYQDSQINTDISNHTMASTKTAEPRYHDFDYCLPGDSAIPVIPCFILGSYATKKLFEGTGIDLADFEKNAACMANPKPKAIKDKLLEFSVSVKSESLCVRNVIGEIKGTDQTKCIVVGAHYDHLGMRNGLIYNGSDDNASGSSGMLALAKVWAESSVQLPCNIIFASWTGEEKGLLGSQYFAQQLDEKFGNILLYVNMDMISRSAPEDTARRILSIGTRTIDEQLRTMAKKINSTLARPFVLDLWDVTGHTGSDYASFTARNIPVMTFFSGFHDDYHTTRDIAPRADLKKMGDILNVVNNCLQDYLDTTIVN